MIPFQKCLVQTKLFDENNSNEAQKMLEPLVEKMCKTQHNPLSVRSVEAFIELAIFFRFVGDWRISAELIWGAASQEIQNLATSLQIRLQSHDSKREFAGDISHEFRQLWCSFECCHSAFYTNRYGKKDIDAAFEDLDTFLKAMKVPLSEEQKASLQKNRHRYEY